MTAYPVCRTDDAIIGNLDELEEHERLKHDIFYPPDLFFQEPPEPPEDF